MSLLPSQPVSMRPAMLLLAVLAAVAPWSAVPSSAQQIFPDTVYAWMKLGEELLPSGQLQQVPGAEAEWFEGFGVTEWRMAEYTRAGRTARIDMATLPSRERAYGLFRVMAEGADPEGIIGDAVGVQRGTVHVNYGPFYFRVSSTDRRATQPPDEALVVRTRRVLYGMADCHGSDFPFPTEERVVGSERYFAPDPRAWSTGTPRGTEDLITVLGSRAAYSAEYRKASAGSRRTLVYFPFRQTAAAVEFAAELVQQLQARSGPRGTNCELPTFTRGGVQRVVAAGAGHVLLVVSDATDTGCCEWVRSLLR